MSKFLSYEDRLVRSSGEIEQPLQRRSKNTLTIRRADDLGIPTILVNSEQAAKPKTYVEKLARINRLISAAYVPNARCTVRTLKRKCAL